MLAALVFWAATLSAAVAGLLPRRRLGLLLLAALGVVCLVGAAVEGGSERTLDVVHPHPAYVGNAVETKDFPIETTRALGYAHWLAGAAFCLLLAALAFARLPAAWPFGWALVLGWGGTAFALVLEKLAAPTAAVAFRMHGALWLAGALAALALAQTRPRVLAYAAVLLLLIDILWLPSAVFSTFATRHGWGTSLDVHTIEFCAHRLAGTPLSLEPGSVAQLKYLVWAPLLLVMPLLTWLSAGGVGFLVLMALREASGRPAPA